VLNGLQPAAIQSVLDGLYPLLVFSYKHLVPTLSERARQSASREPVRGESDENRISDDQEEDVEGGPKPAKLGGGVFGGYGEGVREAGEVYERERDRKDGEQWGDREAEVGEVGPVTY